MKTIRTKTALIFKTSLIALLLLISSACNNEAIEDIPQSEDNNEFKIYTFNESGNVEVETVNLEAFGTLNNTTDLSEDKKLKKTKHRLTVKSSKNNLALFKNVQLNAFENQKTGFANGKGVISGPLADGRIKFTYKTLGLHVSGNEKRAAFIGKITSIIQSPFPNNGGGAGVEVGNLIVLHFREASPNRIGALLTEPFAPDDVAKEFINPGGPFAFGSIDLNKLSKGSKVYARRTK